MQETREINEKVASSITAVERELKFLPPPVGVALAVHGDRVSLSLALDHYHLSMLHVAQVPFPQLPLTFSETRLGEYDSLRSMHYLKRLIASRQGYAGEKCQYCAMYSDLIFAQKQSSFKPNASPEF